VSEGSATFGLVTTSGPSLDPVRAKIDRARLHRDELDQAMRAWASSAKFELVGRLESDGVYRLRFGSVESPPALLALPRADMLGNLRSALDYLAWQLVLASGAQPSPLDSMFPVVRKPEKWASAARQRLAGVDPQWIQVIESMQPYHHGGDPDHHLLGYLDLANNISKHRLLVPAAVAGLRGEPIVDVHMPQPGHLYVHLPDSFAMKTGSMLVGYEVRPVQADFRPRVGTDAVQIGVTFDEGIELPYAETPDLVGFVEDVVSRFEPAFD
jgi:hypothetical protein